MFQSPDFNQLREQIKSATSADVEQALNATRLNLNDLAALISPAAEPYLQQMAARSSEITLARFGKTTQLYAPIYLSNYCTNRCVYCGFSADNRIKRKCLTLDEAEKEAMILHERGFQHILLVSGEAENAVDVEYMEAIALRLRNKFAAVSIEIQPLSTEHYQRLFLAGITAVAVYQETYDRDMYKRVHLSGKKSDFDYRLETPARVAEAGMREVGIGALLGLSDWRAEGLAIGHHLNWLRKTFWSTAFTVSFPRMRPATGEFEPLEIVTESNLSQLIFALRLFDQDVGLIVSTREEARYRDGMLKLGPTRYSAGSCTAPGGYGDSDSEAEQFSVGDHRSLQEVSTMIREKGYDPVYKDWDSSFQITTS
ncbi:tyrosine lyase ThiH [Desulfocapsa sulfexigens DSM 10523]|uniref:Tyrosine lyase ThiH n=1 Tax=Desulfocapsa sulfexigens (strain DSM 10523 / SB164P1) TaxID=1167006 RepID=M1NFM1_DESSD|nr:2-iminoacetate synthase ThiH [Desulfocapsa sulfexigens]AGF78449.1 tyrosine lyase ThiH [Desulfocapsa sulfexigens DSM 10523]